MKIKEIARAFGMTAEQFANYIGYTRQALYEGISMTSRSEMAVTKLHDLNFMIYKAEREEGQRRFEARKNAVKEFERHFIFGKDGE